MALIGSVVGFVVSLLIGALGIYVGASVIAGVEDYTYAVVTALIGSLVWFVVAFFVGWIPFLGPLLALLAYLWIINRRYPGGWLRAAGIALIAWAATLVVVYLLGTLGLAGFEALGVPGV
jgi:hypothetical protein